MNPALVPGARAQVAWSDGRVHLATVCAVAQNMVQVRWDAGGAMAWVALEAIVAVANGATSMATQFGGSAPAPAFYDAYAAFARPPSGRETAGIAATQRPANVPSVPPVARPSIPPTSINMAPPRPMSTIEGLPRGVVYEPIAQGPGNGQAFFVFFGFLATADVDLAMRMTDIDHLGDDVAALRSAGYRVIVDLHGDLHGLNAALTGSHPDAGGFATAGVFWGGHGAEDGSIHTFDGGRIDPEQITPPPAGRATVKLFVMSACHAGSHTARWQKALGPQALVIGWGAPITNERAIEFLTPDDNSAKGFDKLLEQTLGVRRVAADGPLVEARSLAKQHEDRVALISLSFDELVTRAQARLKCQFDRGRDGAAYFTVRTPASKSLPNVPRAQSVRVGPMSVDNCWINVSSIVGPYTAALDLARALRVVSDALHVRVALAKLGPQAQEFVLVESLFRRRRLDVVTLSNNIVSIGIFADRIEDMFFGSDQR